MQAEILLLSTLFLGLLIYHYRDHAIMTRSVKYPSPRPMPVIGNLAELLKNTNDINSFAVMTSIELGLPWVLYIPFKPIIFYILDYQNFDFILKNPYIFKKGHYFKSKLQQALGDGIFNVDGDKWKVQRKIASTLTTTNNFRNIFVPIFERNLELINTTIDKHISENKHLNILSLLGKYALDSFSESSCGKPPPQKFEHMGKFEFERAFEEIQAIVDQRFRIPFWNLYEHLTGTSKKLLHYLSILDEFVFNIIDDRKREHDNGRFDHNDLINKYMLLKKTDGNKLSKKELRDIMLSLLTAGRDTTSHAITWLLLHLVKDKKGPGLINKMLEEFYFHCPDGVLTYDVARDKLYIFQSIFYESLRLFPPVPKNMKTCVKDTVLPNGKILVKKGDLISINPFASARLSVNWGPNAAKFVPERWLNNVDDILKADVSEIYNIGKCPRLLSIKDPRFITFNSGPRRCIGSEFALVESAMVILNIFTKYEVSLSKLDYAYDWTPNEHYLLSYENGDPIYVESLTMPKKNGLLLNFKHRTTEIPIN